MNSQARTPALRWQCPDAPQKTHRGLFRLPFAPPSPAFPQSHLFMARIALLLIVGGLYLICSGCYDLFVQAGASRQPTTVSVAELEKSVPANRHLIVSGGRPVLATA